MLKMRLHIFHKFNLKSLFIFKCNKNYRNAYNDEIQNRLEIYLHKTRFLNYKRGIYLSCLIFRCQIDIIFL